MGGFVYVMTNESVPNGVKIGMTTKHPAQRAKELYTTGVPFPFKVAFAMWVESPSEVEKVTHDYFSQYRMSDAREFFGVGVEEVAKFVTEQYIFSDNVVVNAEEAFDYPDLLMFKEKANLCHVFAVTKMLLCLSDEAIAEAAECYRHQCEERRMRYRIESSVTV
jgi:hypothetical protein